MSIRRPDEDLELGNRIATLLVRCRSPSATRPAGSSSIHAETARLKASEQAGAASLIIEATGWTPPTINRVLAGAMSGRCLEPRGLERARPQVPFYLLGRRLEAIYPFVPLSPQNHALSIGVLSYDGGVFFGLAGDRDVLADIDQLADDIDAALAEQTAGGPELLRMNTGVPSGTLLTSAETSGSAARTHPCEIATPSGPGCRGSRSGCRRASPRAGWAGWRESASAQQP